MRLPSFIGSAAILGREDSRFALPVRSTEFLRIPMVSGSRELHDVYLICLGAKWLDTRALERYARLEVSAHGLL